MSIDYGQIETDMATTIASGLADNVSDGLSTLAIPGNDLTTIFTWNGVLFTLEGEGDKTFTLITGSDTSEVAVGDYLRMGPAELAFVWFKVHSINTDVSVTLENVYSGEAPIGANATMKAAATPPPPVPASSMEPLATAIARGVVEGLEKAFNSAEITGVSSGVDTIGPGVIS